MAILSALEGAWLSTLVLAPAATALVALLVFRLCLHPLNNVPGPYICRITPLWIWYHSYVGDECTVIDKLHKTYGPVLRIAPNEVCISDGSALAPIYSEKGGFAKAPCYSNFDFEGHATIFSARDPAYRSVRSKAVLPMFSTASIRNGNDVIEGVVDHFAQRMKEKAEESRQSKKKGQPRPVNLLNLTRGLALDAVCAYLFGESFGSLDENPSQMSALAFVDSVVGFGRFFFVPNWLFRAIEKGRQRFWPDQAEQESFGVVDGFVEKLLSGSEKSGKTYQERLGEAGITKHEVKIQCEDVIFAGTDSTGMNLSTIIYNLAKCQNIYSKLQHEVAEADANTLDYNPQSLPYLDAVVREGVRIALANPIRLPRVVPPHGFRFTTKDQVTYHLPPGTLVGVQIFSLHSNPDVFPDPTTFRPQRWLDSPTPEMQRDWLPFGLGQRQCIARNFAMTEMCLAVRAIARADVLTGARPVMDKVEILEWFNSKVKGERIDIEWE